VRFQSLKAKVHIGKKNQPWLMEFLEWLPPTPTPFFLPVEVPLTARWAKTKDIRSAFKSGSGSWQ